MYTQVLEYSQALTEPPPHSQSWGDKNFQSRPSLGDLEGEIS
ncbi:hypothetical protein Aazo_5061 ['Nostoc azollae' 0708]|uniref:Uncharacterized protein n=1 Tax=Nostoc azollae (strain 0708) TaxID=551115 RepID=D7DZY9_NOSA0|nr:hypothetical protein Aazo_5061 ['Nostoc azollae' 0708]